MRQLNADAYHDRLAKRRRGHGASVSEAHTRGELCLILAGATGSGYPKSHVQTHKLAPLLWSIPGTPVRSQANCQLGRISSRDIDKALSLLLQYSILCVL